MAGKVTLNGKLLHPTDYIAAAECVDSKGNPKDVTLTIKSVVIEDLQSTDGEKEKKPIMRFVETEKKLVLNKTNAETIAEMYGTKAEDWNGKRITVYPTKVRAFGEMMPCIRIRDKVPAAKDPAKPAAVGEPWDDGNPKF